MKDHVMADAKTKSELSRTELEESVRKNGKSEPAITPKPQRGAIQHEMKDGIREAVETVVFVVVLVLLLKSFVAEAFVIPTGSMATTLWGNQKEVTCPKCGFKFPVNA